MTEVVVIGGSAGSLQVLRNLLNSIPEHTKFSVIVIIHRLKNVASDLENIISDNKVIREPMDKEPIKNGHIYLAPQNYHLLIEEDKTFSLDYSEPVNFSRPSIDVTFECVASVYKEKAVAILLSGANNDGTEGLKQIISNKGVAIVQDPSTAEYSAMPQSAVDSIKQVSVHTPEFITNYIRALNLFEL